MQAKNTNPIVNSNRHRVLGRPTTSPEGEQRQARRGEDDAAQGHHAHEHFDGDKKWTHGDAVRNYRFDPAHSAGTEWQQAGSEKVETDGSPSDDGEQDARDYEARPPAPHFLSKGAGREEDSIGKPRRGGSRRRRVPSPDESRREARQGRRKGSPSEAADGAQLEGTLAQKKFEPEDHPCGKPGILRAARPF